MSGQTYGLRGEYKHKFSDDVTVTGVGEYARQNDYGNNPYNYGLNYYTVEGGAVVGQDKGFAGSLTGKVGYEVLEGDGVSAVQTPMASAHVQNGWADMFNTTPVGGLRDAYVSATYKYQLPFSFLLPTKLQVDYHNFHSDFGAQYGNEFDFDFSQTFLTHYTLGFQYAQYFADLYGADTRKAVLNMTVQF